MFFWGFGLVLCFGCVLFLWCVCLLVCMVVYWCFVFVFFIVLFWARPVGRVRFRCFLLVLCVWFYVVLLLHFGVLFDWGVMLFRFVCLFVCFANIVSLSMFSLVFFRCMCWNLMFIVVYLCVCKFGFIMLS